MKNIYSTLIAVLLLVVFASLADAGTFPSWNKKFNTPARFLVLNQFGNAAVLDRETGLVWEQSPSTSTFTWLDAQSHCNALTTGGRLGWRLPTLQELASLVDPNNPNNPGGNPDLPPGHPFSNVQSLPYWSATTYANSPSNAWVVNFFNGVVLINTVSFPHFVWCVRGGQGVDPQ